jgi:glutamyl/glutaminyl-tRNA synthetase
MAENPVDTGLLAPLLEALERRRVVVRGPPRARALRENLHGVAADRFDAVDRRVDAPGRRDVSPELHDAYDSHVPPVVRFAPSPTGFLHIGGVHTALFNWLFARHEGGEFRLRIENTDTSREVAEAVEQIQDSLRWMGLDWDGEVTLQLDRMEHCRQEAERLMAEGKAYEDEGAIRMRMPDEGVTAWDDLIRGRIEYPNEKLEDVVIVRADGRPTYNFASPVEDWLDGITHVLRGEDHISNTPKQIRILEALGAPLPAYGHLANILGEDGKKLSKRHGAISVEEFRREGYLPDALVNFLALLGWSYDDKTTVMSRNELIERFTLERVGSSPATFDYAKLDWLNGVYLRALAPAEYADTLLAYLREQGLEWDEALVRAAAPLVQEKIAKLGEFPDFAGFLFGDVELDPALLDGSASVLAEAEQELASLEPFTAETIETGLRGLADRLELKPRTAFQPIRVAVTGSKVSPGLFESLELLGRDKSVERIRNARAAGA